MDVWMYGWMDGCMDGWMNGCMDGWMDGWMYGWMDELLKQVINFTYRKTYKVKFPEVTATTSKSKPSFYN